MISKVLATHAVSKLRRPAVCNRPGTAATSGQPRRARAANGILPPDGATTVRVLAGAMSLMRVAQPFTVGGYLGNEPAGEFVSRAIAERVARLQAAHKFVLPPGLSLEFPFT